MGGINLHLATNYNSKVAGRLWQQKDLPWPLDIPTPIPGEFLYPPDGHAFAGIVGMFQSTHGLKHDGLLGPATYALMRSQEPAHPESAASHDFEAGNKIAIPEAKEDVSPARSGVSNCLIINKRSLELPDEMQALGITASNYRDDDEEQFEQYRSREHVTNFVIHESVTMSVAQTNRVLDNKRKASGRKGKNNGKGWDYGIHLNLAPDGHISCHADLIRHRLVHANQMNDDSFGMEVVNPYNPKFGKSPFDITIPGPWWCWKPKNAQKIYTLPTPQQLRTIVPLCKFLVSMIPGLPLEFPTADLDAKQRRIKDWDDGAKPGPGIVAHRDFASHADGRYLLEYVIERLGAQS